MSDTSEQYIDWENDPRNPAVANRRQQYWNSGQQAPAQGPRQRPSLRPGRAPRPADVKAGEHQSLRASGLDASRSAQGQPQGPVQGPFLGGAGQAGLDAARGPRYGDTYTDRDGYKYKWNPIMNMYNVVGYEQPLPADLPGSAAAGSGSGGGGAVNNNYDSFRRDAKERLRQLRFQYLNALSPLQEQQRQSRVMEAEQGEQYRSGAAMRGMGGGISQSGLQRVLDFFRAQQAGVGGQKAALSSGLTSQNLNVQQQLANDISREALRRAAARAAKIRADMDRDFKESGIAEETQ